MAEKIPCSATVFVPRVHSSGCQRSGVINRGGKWYCRQHDPEAVKARNLKWHKDYYAKKDADATIYAEGERIAKALGVDVNVFYHRDGSWTKTGPRRSLVISFEDCLKLVEMVRDAKRAVPSAASEAP